MELLLSLTECDVAVEVAEHIVERVKEKAPSIRVKRFEDKRKAIRRLLREVLLEMLSRAPPFSLEDVIKFKNKRPFVILFVGPNGHGKTTTIAKVAKYLKDRGLTVVLSASDTFRAGAIEQLEVHAKRLNIPLIKHRYGADPAAVAYDAVMYAKKRRIDVVLIDTAGRLQSDVNLMEEMRKIARVVKPDLTIFVGDALTGNDALDQALKFNSSVGIDASILTKADADAKGGAVLSIVYATGKPVIFLGTGQGYDDLREFKPEEFVLSLLGGE